MNQYEAILQSIIDGDEQKTISQCRELIEQGSRPVDILEKGMIPAMDRLGELLAREERFIPQILLSARAMQSAVALIRPLLLRQTSSGAVHNCVVVGTVRGDIHTIGKNLVGIMLQSAGFRVVDLGVDVGDEEFVRAVRESGSRIVAMSALLTTSMNSMRQAVQRLRREDFGYPLRIIVGGGPITPSFAGEIRAEFAANLMDTVRLALAAETETQEP